MTIWTPKLDPSIESKYRAIAAALEADIVNGSLQAGQKLPTQRALATQLSVTIGTIGRAYALVEKQGLISLETGRGSFVRSLAEPETDGNSGLVDLGLNLPPRTCQPDLVAKSLAQLASFRDLPQLFDSASTFSRHTQAAAEWLGRRIPTSASNVMISSGNQPALISALSTLTRPGDTVLVEELTFPGIIAAARLLGLELLAVPMDGQGIIPEKLERLARKAKVLYCIPTNQNPTTVTMSKSRRREIAQIATRKKLSIIEDDVYGQLIDNAPAPLSAWLPDQAILISSLAKTMSVGLRLAFVRVPEQWLEIMNRNLHAAQFFPAPLMCELATRWIKDGTADRLLEEKRQSASKRQKIAAEVLGKVAKLKHLGKNRGNPGGNHIWLNLPSTWRPETFEHAAKLNGVNVFSSTTFAVDQQTAEKTSAIRIALGGARNESELRMGLQVIARLLSEPVPPSNRY